MVLPYAAIFVFSFLGGVAARSFFAFDATFSLFLFPLAGALAVFGWRFSRRGHEWRVYAASALILCSFALGAIRTAAALPDPPALDPSIGEHVTLAGFVYDEPEAERRSVRIPLRVATREGAVLPHDERVLLHVPPLEAPRVGDYIETTGILLVPENFYAADDLAEGRAFDWAGYLERRGVYYEIWYPETTVVPEKSPPFSLAVKRALISVRDVFTKRIRRVVPEPEAALIAGETVGEQSTLAAEHEEALRRTGIIHVIVLSGYNVTIIAESIMRMLSFLPRTLAFYIAVSSIILFALMTGASATVMRAAIMATLLLAARRYGRLYAVTRALVVAGFLMVLYEPYLLVFDLSFQLSFLATLGLIYLGPAIENRLGALRRRWRAMASIVGATVSTQLFVLPLLVSASGEISLVSLPVNMLILLSVPPTMFFGFLAGLFGLFSHALSAVPGLLAAVLARYQFAVVSVFDSFSQAAVPLPPHAAWVILFVYAVAASFFFLRRACHGRRAPW